MNRKLIWKDIVRNKVVSIAIMLFIAAASMLLSLSGILATHLLGSIDQLMQKAKTPHFMQMHSGEANLEQVERFAKEDGRVEKYQALEFLNMASEKIIIGGKSLAGNVQDNGFCTQSGEFDYLLDMDDQPVRPKDGELYVPVCYYKDQTAKIGDRAVIAGQDFEVAGFIRDSQMNSSLASSKRFLVSGHDYARLKSFGTVEYLIEFRLKDLSELGEFETAYEDAGLPSNGAALTWPLFRMISAVSDGIMIALIWLASMLVILIALLCIRFTLLAKIEDDYREIGVMKAIGMRVSDIQGIYLSIYAAVAGGGCLLGFLLSLLFRKPLQEGIRLNFGNGGSGVMALLLGLGGDLLLLCMILLYLRRILKRFRKLSAAQAIRSGSAWEKGNNPGIFRLSGNRCLSTNLFLGLRDIITRKRMYLTMLVTAVLAMFLMIVPQNLSHTISDSGFVSYLGIGHCDLRMDIQQTEGIGKKAEEIDRYMAKDPDIKKYAVFTTRSYRMRLEDDTQENIKVETGRHDVFPVQYTQGSLPISKQDIALSALYAKELEKQVGDRITLLTGTGEKELVVCGIYYDITNGGKTAKAVFPSDDGEAIFCTVCAEVGKTGQLPDKIAQYEKYFPFAKVTDIETYIGQTFGQTLRSVRTAALAAAVVAAAVTLLITLLFMKLLTAKDRYSIAIMKSTGFSNSDITKQYVWRAVLVTIAGIFLGTMLTGTVGEQLAGAAMASLGASAFQFQVNPLSAYLLSPAILLLTAVIAAIASTNNAGKVHISQSIKE